jgi:hypothetical protein
MSERLIGKMDDGEFSQMIEAFIDRPAGLDDEIPAELVFAMLDKAEQTGRALEMHTAIVGDRLVLSAPPQMTIPSKIRELEVNLPGVKVVVSLEPAIA